MHDFHFFFFFFFLPIIKIKVTVFRPAEEKSCQFLEKSSILIVRKYVEIILIRPPKIDFIVAKYQLNKN